MTKYVAVLALVAMVSGCSFLEKLGVKGADVDLAQDTYECVKKAVEAVENQDLTHDQKIDVASKSAAECSKPVVARLVK